jgi:sugar lactone lactonase YvrE
LNQLYLPEGLIVDDDDGTVYIADWWNNRVMTWKQNEIVGRIVVGENRNELEDLFRPSDLVIDKEQNCFIISDNGKRRVVRFSCKNTITSVETILDNILCWGLTIDDAGSLYVTDIEKHEVRRYRRGEKMTTGTIVAGGNKQGKLNNQLNTPLYVFVDSEHTIYVSDHDNHRVMKWAEGATEGILVAGGQSNGQDLAHLWCPNGIIVDKEGTIYIADSQNHRVMRWRKGAHQGELIAGGHGQGENADQLNEPKSLSFDNSGNLYVADKNNHRVQLFLTQ